ncbi:hypothetical protein AYI68_g5597 [Smittium mucronatum]|uniref:Uncharacterized protein n=1 Tax=Smittium mucronatum TaxID=133383 RepID=A0A1R0GTT7_9FUNG|nr:hypothetical protein AYI68_g5597 [Smittium mucronatum]
MKLLYDQIITNDSKNYSRTIKSYTGNALRSISYGPVYDNNKNVVTEKNKKLGIWNNHFGGLANYNTGNIRKITMWESLISITKITSQSSNQCEGGSFGM